VNWIDLDAAWHYEALVYPALVAAGWKMLAAINGNKVYKIFYFA